jgi:hypothetical protein
MSSILKALKKLEDEKHAAAPVNLAARIVAEPAAARHSSHGMLRIAAGATGGLLLAIAVIYGWFWLRSAEPDGVPVQGALPAQSGPLVPATGLVSEQPALSSKRPVGGVSDRPAGQVAESRPAATAPSPVRLLSTVPMQPLPPPAGQIVPPQAAAVPASHEPPPPEINVDNRQIPPPGQQWAAPHLEVTEIFPPSAGSSWMAVVNGLPVMDGTMVEDVEVEEIRADRVLFLIQGKVVAVPLNKGR